MRDRPQPVVALHNATEGGEPAIVLTLEQGQVGTDALPVVQARTAAGGPGARADRHSPERSPSPQDGLGDLRAVPGAMLGTGTAFEATVTG